MAAVELTLLSSFTSTCSTNLSSVIRGCGMGAVTPGNILLRRRNVNAIQDKDWMKELTCYQCQEKGHISKDCPKWKGKAGKTFGQPGWKPKPDRTTFRQTRKFNNAKRLNLILKVKVEDKKYKPVRKTPGSAGYDLVLSESGMIKP